MAFITHLSKSSNPLLLSVLLLLIPISAKADGIVVSRAQARLTESGQLAISSRFQTELPGQLKQALQQGVPLHFTLNYQLSSPTLPAYKFRLSQIVGSENQVTYKLSYHPLTSRYRISVGTFSTEYSNLTTALRGIGAISDWKVLPLGTLSDHPVEDIRSEVKLSLSTAKLPRPFQINAINSKNWQLDSGWQPLTISAE